MGEQEEQDQMTLGSVDLRTLNQTSPDAVNSPFGHLSTTKLPELS